MSDPEQATPLKRGWTTGACASGAARAAFEALLTGRFPDPVPVALPKGLRPEFALATYELGADFARAGIVKDAGDDPDVTHGALIIATVRRSLSAGVSFKAGEGVGMVTRPGLPLPVGEPAINPGPRTMIRANLEEVASRLGVGVDAIVEISVPDGERIAKRTANGRLGILGGLSILGTTGIVIPYSCSAWIHSIHRGVDVARASGCIHIGAATGETSEGAIRALYGLPDHALIEMGDFVGGLLKYLRQHPVPRLTIAGGPAKMTKLAEGKLDLHSKRGAVDLAALAEHVALAGGAPALAEAVRGANSGLHAFELAQAAGFDLPALVADGAWATAARVLAGQSGELETVVVGRDGRILASSGFRGL
ncbi:MAG TPA: cobalt-precorrin-5B (C(1))-methyltransferase [Roseiarcus sp.]